MVDTREPTGPFDSFLFPKVFQTFRLSIQPTKLLLALASLAVICLAGWIMDNISHTVVIGHNGLTELDVYVSVVLNGETRTALFRDSGERTGVYAALWRFASEHLHAALLSLSQIDLPGVGLNLAACLLALVWAFKYHLVYSLIFFVIVLAVLSVGAGAICRIAALEFARRDKPGMMEAVRFGIRKFISFITAPVIPVVIILVLGALIALLGLWGNMPVVGELSVGLFLPLALAAAAVIAIIIVGVAGGFGLMFPTIAYEDSDCFDAISHSFSYTYATPWRLGFYAAVAFVYGAICYAFVRFFLLLILWVAYFFLQVGFMQDNAKLRAIWSTPSFAELFGTYPPATTGWSTSVSAFLIHVWTLLAVGLMIAFVISFYFSASTIIYALVRRCVDKVGLDEVYVPADTTATEPAPTPASTHETPMASKPQSTDEPDVTEETSE